MSQDNGTPRLQDIISEIDRASLGDWNSPRVKMYIAACIARTQKLEQDLAFERKVNDRVNEVFKGWFHRSE